MLVYDGQVTRHHSAGAALDEVECLLLVWGVEVIKEDPSYSPSLRSVPDVEISVTPRHQTKKQRRNSLSFSCQVIDLTVWEEPAQLN